MSSGDTPRTENDRKRFLSTVKPTQRSGASAASQGGAGEESGGGERGRETEVRRRSAQGTRASEVPQRTGRQARCEERAAE